MIALSGFQFINLARRIIQRARSTLENICEFKREKKTTDFPLKNQIKYEKFTLLHPRPIYPMYFTSLKNCSDIESISICFIAVKCILINGRLPTQQQKLVTPFFVLKKMNLKHVF